MIEQSIHEMPTLLFFFLFLLHNNAGRSAPRRFPFIYSVCSDEKYQPNTPYQVNLNTLLTAVAAYSSRFLSDIFAVGNDTAAPPDTASFGIFQCRGDLRPRDCSACIAALIGQVKLLCPDAYGAAVQLDACFARYGKEDFLGVVDTSLKHKRCSATVSTDAESPRRRDEVLADLLRRVGGFRVDTVGAVEGYAQCLADLTEEDCSACVAAAAEGVKSLCGAATGGDVFLAKCYVRYWETGYYDSSPPSDSSSQYDMGKTVALIIGVVAGAAILVILLAICKRSLR